MTDLNLIHRCPSWCGHHDVDGLVHEAVVGFAGSLEVCLVRSVLPDDDHVDELQLRDIGGQSTASEEVTMPLDPATLRALAEVLAQAARAAEGNPGA